MMAISHSCYLGAHCYQPRKDKLLRVIYDLDIGDAKVICAVRQLLLANTSNAASTAYRVNCISRMADHLISREC
jgi:hypothetical protein